MVKEESSELVEELLSGRAGETEGKKGSVSDEAGKRLLTRKAF